MGGTVVVIVMRVWVVAVALVAGCAPTSSLVIRPPTREELRTRAERNPNPVLRGALKELETPTSYNAEYAVIPYPGGDVPKDRGACADVIVRALRYAGYDLQQLIHDDSTVARYPNIKRRDTNIDHRRVLNQEVYFKRHGQSLTTEVSARTLDAWQPGDIVTWRLPAGQHTGIISDRKRPDGAPLVIHNMGSLCEEDILTAFRIVGHFRFPAKTVQG